MSDVGFTVGPPGAGKSTFVKQQIDEPCQRISTDEIRRSLAGDSSDMKATQAAYDIASRMLRYRVDHSDQMTYIDIVGLSRRYRTWIYEVCTSPPEAYLFDQIDFELCVERCEERQRRDIDIGYIEEAIDKARNAADALADEPCDVYRVDPRSLETEKIDSYERKTESRDPDETSRDVPFA